MTGIYMNFDMILPERSLLWYDKNRKRQETYAGAETDQMNEFFKPTG